jgi:hypothetical protein
MCGEGQERGLEGQENEWEYAVGDGDISRTCQRPGSVEAHGGERVIMKIRVNKLPCGPKEFCHSENIQKSSL